MNDLFEENKTSGCDDESPGWKYLGFTDPMVEAHSHFFEMYCGPCSENFRDVFILVSKDIMRLI